MLLLDMESPVQSAVISQEHKGQESTFLVLSNEACIQEHDAYVKMRHS